MLLISAGQFFAAGQLILEERFLSTRDHHPIQAAGVEGTAAAIIYIILLIIFNNIPCSEVRDAKGNVMFCPFGLVENTVFAFKQMDSRRLLMGLVIACTFIIIIEDTSGVCIVKGGSAMQRAIGKCLRSLCVWSVSMGIGWEHFMWTQVSLAKT